ncbi:MAG: endonuclease III [Bacillota bacterium]|nr:endonuclease III [Bacillota bacterium]
MSYLKEILVLLEQEYPMAQTSLYYHTSFQLLLAVILSTQTTDKQVNKITEKLFKTIKAPQDILDMGLAELVEELKRCGLYHQKSRQIMETSRLLIEKYGGEVPGTRDELITLPGVGRKTANVVLSTVFGIPAFAVDTHVRRVSQRLGWTCEQDMKAIEDELCRLIPRELWGETHHRLIDHGRRFCKSKRPLCSSCPFSPSYCTFEPE